MRFLPPEPEVKLYEEGFEESDVLGRQKVGQALSDFVNRIEDPLVIALHGGWGTGKSYFLKRWVGAHAQQNETCTTVYFDAFAHDHISDPLTALIAVLGERLPHDQAHKFDKVKHVAFKFARPIARIGLAVATAGATEVLNPIADAAAKGLSATAKDAFDSYWNAQTIRQNAMEEFQTAIAALTAPADEDGDRRSLVFVIDELDRCRPDYALEVLEVIKHFFSVDSLHFVLGVNLSALENSVRARYGSGIDAEEYLRKFIQIRLELPHDLGNEYQNRPAVLLYFDTLVQEMGTPDHVASPLRQQIEVVMRSNAVSLRDIGKVLSLAAVADEGFLNRTNWLSAWLDVMATLLVSRVIHPSMYQKFLSCTATREELVDYFDARPEMLSGGDPSKRGAAFDRLLEYLFSEWLILCRAEGHDELEENFRSMLVRAFDDFGHEENFELIPRKVQRQWLDGFSFFGQSE